MKQSPTALSLALLRKTCQAVEVVEHWNPHARIRKDLFGFIDILALDGAQTIAIQSTSWANTSARARKIAESPLVGFVRDAGWQIIIHGWRKNAKSNSYEVKTLDVS